MEEGIELRQAGITKPILILGFTPAPLYPSMIEYDIATAVFQYDMAKKMSDAAVQLGKKAKIHISLDTGMSRIGFALTEESLQTICKINQLPGIEIEGCFSHFARMDEKDKTKAEQQFSRYETFVHKMEQAGVKIPVKHISNSAGIMEMPKVNEDMVRDGICLYGLYPSEEVNKERLPLEPAMQWKTYVSYVKELEAGIEIGYGGTYTTTKPTMVATIPVGYADGYARSLSGKGCVLIHGQRAPILGRICMDQFMVDVTDIPDVKNEDEVILIGRDGDECITMEEVGGLSGRFNYEFACDLGKRIPRVYIHGGRIIGTRDHFSE